MTTAITKALAWEHLQRAKWPFLVAFSISMAVCLAGFIGTKLDANVPPVLETIYGWSTFGQVLLIGAILFAFCNSDDIKLSIPDHHALLPISAMSYILCRLTLLLSTVALSAIIATHLPYLFFGSDMKEFIPRWDLLIVCTMIFAMLQPLAWLLGSAGVFPALILVALLGLLSRIFPIVPLTTLFDFELTNPDSYTWPVATGILLASYGLSCTAVVLQKRGKLDFIENWTDMFNFLSPRRERNERPFASPRAAMLWFEWRRQTRQLPMIAVFLTLIFFSAFAYVDIRNSLERSERVGATLPPETLAAVYGDGALGTAAIALGIALCIATGMFFFKNYRAQNSGMRIFLFTRPVETRDLAAARMTSILKCIGITLIPFSILALIVLYLDSRTEDFGAFHPYIELYPGIKGTLILLGSLIGIATAMWVMLWLGDLLLIGCAAAVSSLALTALNQIFHFADHIALERYTFALTAILTSIITIGLFIQAHRRKLLSPKYLKTTAFLSPILILSVLTMLSWDSLESKNGLETSVLATSVPILIVLAILPLATVPLTMHWTRHR